MKNKLLFIAIAMLFVAVGCIEHEVTEGEKTRQTFNFTATTPDDGVKTRVTLAETQESDISVTWKSGDNISLCFVSGATVKTLSNIALTNIRENGKKADFSFTLPVGIDYPFNLYGVYGATLTPDSKTVTFPAATLGSTLSDSEPVCVMRFAAENITAATSLSVAFTHLGAVLGAWLTNTSATDYSLTSLSLTGKDNYNWLYNATGQATYDIASGTFIDNKAGTTLNFPLGTGITISAGATTKLYQWIVPTATPDASKAITATQNGTAMSQALPAKAFTAGKYYRLKLVWTGITWNYLSMPPASDLVAHWPMDGNANDISGNNHHGTIFGGVTPTSDHKGQPNAAYFFNGTNGYIDVGDWELGGPMTFAVWARWDALNNWSRIFDFGNGPESNNIYCTTYNTTDYIEFGFFIGQSYYNARTSSIITTGNWDFYVMSINNSVKIKLYKNGICCAEHNINNVPLNIIRANQYIGKSNWSSDGLFKGAMNDMRIYNRALTDNEVMSLYLMTK